MENNPSQPTNPATENPATRKSSHGTYVGIAAFLEDANTTLTNAQLPAVQSLLESRGITPTEVSARLREVETLRSLNEQQRKEYGEQYEATKAYNDARALIHEDYMDHIALARIVFKNDIAAKTALGLQGERPRSQSGYVNAGLLFYSNAMASQLFTAALAKKGINVQELLAGQTGFKNLQTLSAAQQKETGEAQAATQQRDAAYDALSEWMSEFRITAKVALRKYPQYREQLGIRERS